MHGPQRATDGGRRRPWHRSRAVPDARRWVIPNRVVVLGVAMLVVSWWYATDSVPTTVDRHIGQWALRLPDSLEALLDVAMITGTVWCYVIAIAVAVCAGRFRLALGVAVAGATAWIGAAVIEHVVSSSRPTSDELGEAVRGTASGGGYPAAPVAMSVALSLMLLTSIRSTRVVAIGRRFGAGALATLAAAGVATATGLATLYTGINWFTDVAGGAGLGIVAGVVGLRAGRRRRSAVSNQWI